MWRYEFFALADWCTKQCGTPNELCRCATSLPGLQFFVTNATASYPGPVQNHICGAMIDALLPIFWTVDDAALRFLVQDIPDAAHVEHLHDIFLQNGTLKYLLSLWKICL